MDEAKINNELRVIEESLKRMINASVPHQTILNRLNALCRSLNIIWPAATATAPTDSYNLCPPSSGTVTKPTTIEVVHGILDQAIKEVGDRATTYDKPQGEESMPHIISLFNGLYRTKLTVEQGWMFMCLLKIVRSASGKFKRDNYVDLAAYAAFAAKAAMDERSD